MSRKSLVNWLDKQMIRMKTFVVQKNEGMGTVEVILIIVVIFTIYMGCK